jgi:hypothetical protein
MAWKNSPVRPSDLIDGTRGARRNRESRPSPYLTRTIRPREFGAGRSFPGRSARYGISFLTHAGGADIAPFGRKERTRTAIRQRAAAGIGGSLDAVSGSWFVILLDGRVLGIAMHVLRLLLLASG